MLGDEAERRNTLAALELLIETETDPVYEDMKKDLFELGDRETLGGLDALENQINLLDETKKLTLLRKKKAIATSSFPEAVKKFEAWVCFPRLVFSDQESQDAQTEVQRLRHWITLLCYKALAAGRGVCLPARVTDPMNNMIRRMKVSQMR